LLQLIELLTDFQSSFTDTLQRKQQSDALRMREIYNDYLVAHI